VIENDVSAAHWFSTFLSMKTVYKITRLNGNLAVRIDLQGPVPEGTRYWKKNPPIISRLSPIRWICLSMISRSYPTSMSGRMKLKHLRKRLVI